MIDMIPKNLLLISIIVAWDGLGFSTLEHALIRGRLILGTTDRKNGISKLDGLSGRIS